MDFFLRPWLLSKFQLILSKRAVCCLTAPEPLDLQKKLKVLLNADNQTWAWKFFQGRG